ncbi:hypothetical protein K458DRAFT_398805 [Lentithecium fluviatile CBS 122367]|uniref:Uncharacterized protein n=1 Tax=Lentithecium fluviatile CBS 122367 TaxID=1168545 RepID=A0A6G1JKS9_9PLEO|nr:hypothetical protein K458DRAFT_398805 [Lentithecium fluviatile CBS 122367]
MGSSVTTLFKKPTNPQPRQMSGNSMDKSMAHTSTLKQTGKRLFLHLRLTAYACLKKPDGHTFLRAYVTGSRLSAEKNEAYMEKVPPMKLSTAELVGSPGALGAGTVLWIGVQVESANDYRPKAKGANAAASSRSKHARISDDDVINDDRQSREKLQRPSIYSKFVRRPRPVAIGRKIQNDLSEYRVNPNQNTLRRVIQTLQTLQADLKQRPEVGILGRLLDTSTTFEAQGATAAADAFKVYPEVRRHGPSLVSTEAMLQLATALRETTTKLRYGHLHFVVIDVCRKIKKTGLFNERSTRTAEPEDSVSTAKLICLKRDSTFPNADSAPETYHFVGPFLHNHIEMMKTIHQQNSSCTEQLKERAGPPHTTLDLKKIMQRW